MEQRYQKFRQSRQEPLRLAIALDGFFQDTDPVRQAAYGDYLRRRLQPAVQRLVEADDTRRLSRLAPWFTARQTDAFIARAGERQKTAASPSWTPLLPRCPAYRTRLYPPLVWTEPPSASPPAGFSRCTGTARPASGGVTCTCCCTACTSTPLRAIRGGCGIWRRT